MSEFPTHDAPLASPALTAPPLRARRTAAFRPGSEATLRSQTLAAFYADMEHDVALGPHEEGSLAPHLFALALVEEARGAHESASLLLNQYRHAHGPSDTTARAARRNWRQLDEWTLVERSLRASRGQTPLLRALDTLEATQLSWLMGAPGDQIALSLEGVLAAPEAHDQDQGFVTTWRTLLLLDVLLSQGALDDAAELLEQLAATPALHAQIRAFAHLMLAGASQLQGNQDAALSHLLTALPQRDWSQELVDWLAHLLGSTASAKDLLDLVPDSVSTGRFMAAYRARLAQTGGAPERAKLMLDAALHAHDTDALTLALHEEVLEALGAASPHGEVSLRQALIQVLNLRLEATTNEDECVSILLRIGRLYESLPGADAAAAEVYREALGLVPDDASVLRALGRLYHRNGSFDQLVSLCEHEIVVFAGDGALWRRHFQVAKLYEEHLLDPHAALEHYTRVLDTHPNFLPALKACARLLEQTGQWAMLAGIFLERVPGATSTRQRLYLLDKVAHIAEDHLGDLEIAIGAWQEILAFAPDHPNAYSALGRLYSRTGAWHDLIALNRLETTLLEDAEEVADLFLKNAQIHLNWCDDAPAAEQCYREALGLVPDFLPALEGLGHLLVSQGRWEEVMAMTSREIAALNHPRHQARQLGALAEVAEFQLGHPQDAITLHEEALELTPGNLSVYFTLHRLYRQTRQWAKLAKLKEERLCLTTESAELASLYGELAELYEWHLGERERAFHAYRAALSILPGQRHWLDGLVRLQDAASLAPAQVVAWLEQLCDHPDSAPIQDRYLIQIARLREQLAGSAEAGLDVRRKIQHPGSETGVLRRLAEPMVSRDSLVKLRAFSPLFPWEAAFSIPRHKVDAAGIDLHSLWSHLPEGTKLWMAQELELCAASTLEVPALDQEVMLGLELGRIHTAGTLVCQTLADPSTSSIRQHLRVVEARCQGDAEEGESWLRREMSKLGRSDLWLCRGLELAALVGPESPRHLDLLEQAARPLLEPPGTSPRRALIDSPVIETLYDALYRAAAWPLLRRCLEAHLSYPDLGKIRASYLYDMLSDMLERFVQDPAAARHARLQCWELTAEPDHLLALVRLSKALGHGDEAIEYQRAFLGQLWPRRDIQASRCIEAGLEFARLLREHTQGGAGLKEALEVLEAILARFESTHDCVDVRLELARAHASGGDPRLAIDLFKGALVQKSGRPPGRLARICEVVEGRGRGLPTAYTIQWTLVRHDPANHQDMQTLIDLAEEAEALDDCALELVRLAKVQPPKVAGVLMWAAATIYDEFLGWFEDACDLYDDLLVHEQDPAERVRLLRRQAFCFARIPHKQSCAMATFHRLLEADPFDVATYRGMAVLLGEIDTQDRARIVMQIQRALGDQIEVERVRTKTVPSRPIEDAGALDILLPPGPWTRRDRHHGRRDAHRAQTVGR